jgi:hypothetical protein
VENLFYVSFLIRDGIVGIGRMPTGYRHSVSSCRSNGICNTSLILPPDGSSASTRDQIKNNGMAQAIFHLDFPIWEDLIGAFDITAP